MEKNIQNYKIVGVLALQGSVVEHLSCLNKVQGVKAVAVKTKKEIEVIDGLIIPGGESTAIGKLLEDFDLMDILRNRIISGMPVWGTCAGMILLAKKISNHDRSYLAVMDIKVMRNAYGSQLESFKSFGRIPAVSDDEIPMVFIRAPYIEEVWNGVEVLAELDNKIIACRQNNMLATSFHPELTDDLKIHKYFVENMVYKDSRPSVLRTAP